MPAMTRPTGWVDALSGTVAVVTGGLGFIGSNIVHRLVSHGVSVRVIDSLVHGHGGDRRNLLGLPDEATVDVTTCDLGDPSVADVIDGADIVFNVAGQVSHIASMVDPETDLHHNTTAHIRFLELLRRVQPDARVVHTSTRQVYGRPIRLPVDETHPARPVDVNGVAKLAGEQLHMVYAQVYGLRATSLRLTNVYGPRQRLTSDQLGFLPVFIRTALEGGVIELFGTGEQRRDCLHVDDVVDAALAATSDATVGAVFNVGHRTTHTLNEVADLLVRLSGETASIRHRPWPTEHERIDIGSFETDSSALRDTVGWTPSTDLADGLESTIAFYREHPWYLSST
jgi:UDP-glucose 4-epimerase